jgi:hypothetical protein
VRVATPVYPTLHLVTLIILDDIVAYLLHARTVVPEKEPLLSNTRTQQKYNGFMQPVSKHQFGKREKQWKSGVFWGDLRRQRCYATAR